ncbi:FtsX-like permease family protein [Aquisphaera giovannonii]|uniref:FtsX-like permease family protein n=1 Tax=Aquisphaera giovannonii TaxID=406548 RepID=A0A5B9WER8_9BACT|nr:ABC transporter permease [Aquisphaera giovannonii]QEH39146.1 FtsX-like permease family protein [Aquisphaera giovannonii]
MNGAEFRAAAKLAFSHARQRPGRIVLTSLSTIAAACVVVWVVSGYDSLVGRFGDMGEEYVGRYDLLVIPSGGPPMMAGPEESAGPAGPRGLSNALLDAIRSDPGVASVAPVYESRASIRRAGSPPPRPGEGPMPAMPAQPKAGSGPIIMGGMAQLRGQARSPSLVGTDSAEPLQPVVAGRWFDPAHPGRREAAITRDSAEALGVTVGDELVVGRAMMGMLGGMRGGSPKAASRPEPTVKVVAIVEQPRRLPPPKFMVGLPPSRDAALQGGPAGNAVYVPAALAAELAGAPPRPSYAGVLLKPGVKADDFAAGWAERLSKATPPAEARTPGKVEGDVAGSTTFETVRAQAWSATGISLLAALFIIFTTLSMGVDERIRQLAMLRAVALTRSQVALMVGVEGLLLGLIGWAGGLLAGRGLLSVMARLRPDSVSEGAALGSWCVVLSGLCALGGSIAASILPAWRAVRVSPLEAMAPRRGVDRRAALAAMTAVGLLLIAVNPLLVFYVPMQDAARYGMSAAIGCTSMAVGFALLAPAAIVLVERLLGPVVAKVLGLNPRLLAMQLSTNLWRTAGATVALTVGLGLFVAMQTWGYSMLAPFTPGDWTPDLMIQLGPGGIPDEDVRELRRVKGLAPGRLAAVASRQVRFADDPTGFRERPSATRQDTCLMLGVDPELALAGADPLFAFDFAEGNREEAVAKLKRGRYSLVPDHFAREANLGVGGKFRVIAPDRPGEVLEYEVAGIVSMPGWHWMTKTIRRGRAAGVMVAGYDQIRADFRTGRPSLFWGDMDGSATEDEIRAAVEPIAARSSGPGAARAGGPPAVPGAGPRRPAGPPVTLRSAASVREQIRGRADGIIWALSQLPLVTLAVTSLGVVNAVLASIRARRWELGVLRAVGLTRWGLARVILAESLLVGAVACLLSLGFGAMAGYCGTGVSRYISIRGGQYTPLVIPWYGLSVGFGSTLGLCLLAALWPAIRTGLTEPLKLLQAGRAAT